MLVCQRTQLRNARLQINVKGIKKRRMSETRYIGNRQEIRIIECYLNYIPQENLSVNPVDTGIYN